MKRFIAIAVFSFLFYGQTSAGTSACVLPVADGGDVESSPPSAQGVIANVSHDQIVLNGQKSKPIRLEKETKLFTVYGGFVEAKDIKVGQHVFVWFVGCKEALETPPIAAVIQLCLTAAEPCLK